MKFMKNIISVMALIMVMFVVTSCHDLLEEAPENEAFTKETDYTAEANMIFPLLGAYAEFYERGWEDYPLIAVRGDDVNAGGKGDQQELADADKFIYNNPDYWMFNSVWQNLYKDVFVTNSAMAEITLYKEHAANAALADQYIAEAKVIRAFLLLQLSRVWGDIMIPTGSDLGIAVPKDEVMQHLSDQMDEAIPFLPNMHPNERTDIKGGVTRYTALAIKALANLELKNYHTVADATSQIISSNEFALEPDFYELFKLKGKLNRENVFELQYSDFGQGSGDNQAYTFAFFGPQEWTPKVTGAAPGWGFWEPSFKYIKFMIDRGERERLETSVIFTNRGIDSLKTIPGYAQLPAWITNTTPSGDLFKDYPRAFFASGKHYLPSDQLTPGRTEYGTNKNFTCIRYAEVLLMHAEALTMGATSAAMTADAAVNLVRERSGLTPLAGVTHQQVMDEKYAELAMEWGTRYFDMVRLGEFDDLSYDGRTFTAGRTFLPYPQAQVDLLPGLSGK